MPMNNAPITVQMEADMHERPIDIVIVAAFRDVLFSCHPVPWDTVRYHAAFEATE